MARASVLTSTNYVSHPETLEINLFRTQDSRFEIGYEQQIHKFHHLFSVFGAEINNSEYPGRLVKDIASLQVAAVRIGYPHKCVNRSLLV